MFPVCYWRIACRRSCFCWWLSSQVWPTLSPPSATVQLGSTLAVFWLLMSLGLVGVVQGFLWPHSGVFQAVVVGGLVVLTQGLLSWAKVDAGREELQLALYTWMVWVSICLIGAWVGLLLREVSGLQPRGISELPGEELPAYARDIGEE